jgi:hypothetical protein
MIGSSLGAAGTVGRADLPDRAIDRPPAGRTLRYHVRGIRLDVTSDLEPVLEVVDATYAAFRLDDGTARRAQRDEILAFSLAAQGGGGPCLLSAPGGRTELLESPAIGLLALLEAMVGEIVAALHRRGVFAVHAGAVVGRSGAAVIAGRSGQGKTTLVLGLVRHGLGLLSDELALLDPATGLVEPYRRSAHVRPTTLGLIPELRPLSGRPTHRLGGGVEWTVGPQEVAGLLGGRLADATPLATVILLDGIPDPSIAPRLTEVAPAVAALELLRTTWAASIDFSGTLTALGAMLAGTPCVRLAVGDFEATVLAVAERLERDRG